MDYKTWATFYMELADKLLEYKNDRRNLLDKLQKVYQEIGMKFPKLESDNSTTDIHPFTVFGMFNKGLTDKNRSIIAGGMAKEFGLKSDVPTSFDGIPTLPNINSLFSCFIEDRTEGYIDNIWNVYESALLYSADMNDENRKRFCNDFDIAKTQLMIKWNLTMGLYWIRPFLFCNFDSRNRWFITKESDMPEELKQKVAIFHKLDILPNGEEYLEICQKCNSFVQDKNMTFPEFSHLAFVTSVNENKIKKEEKEAEQIKIAEETVDYEIKEQNSMYYGTEDLFSEAHLSVEECKTILELIKVKKNVILQGAPGVGKTYLAKRFAYALIGEKNEQRVKMIQFHQSYSYEDFIVGYRPSESGFKIETGVFYDFCRKAQKDKENDYFFIIDEINRGNLSKIFGELFMLIEADKRGEVLKLLYKNEDFTVPENLYIIGMMNTADRSLAMMDYALRRRFAFYTINPQFDSDSFITYSRDLNNDKLEKLIDVIKRINVTISEDVTLGSGFCIGHSYFCKYEEIGINDNDLRMTIEYEIIPLLQEYWFDEPNKIRDFSQMLRDSIK